MAFLFTVYVFHFGWRPGDQGKLNTALRVGKHQRGYCLASRVGPPPRWTATLDRQLWETPLDQGYWVMDLMAVTELRALVDIGTGYLVDWTDLLDRPVTLQSGAGKPRAVTATTDITQRQLKSQRSGTHMGYNCSAYGQRPCHW